ncbi:MAG: XRE family transcriptional regulator, partial [Stutzerimonas stutzeri]
MTNERRESLRLKELREARGMTQQQMADAIGMHLTNYNKL